MIDINKLKLSTREQNIARILNCFIHNEEVASLDIGKETGLSVSTISRVLSLLKKKKIIVNCGKEHTDLGRRPERMRLNKDFGHVVFLDVFQDKIVSFLADLNDQIIDRQEFVFEEEITLDVFKKGLTNVYGRLMQNKRRNDTPILIAGISIPGVVNEDDNTISKIPNIYSFNEINLSGFITEILNIPALICNDSSLVALGHWIELYPTYDSLVYVSFTEPMGIGGGIIIDGKLFKGANYAAGEIGNMFIETRNLDDQYVSAGCMETIAGLGKLYDELYRAIKAGKAPKLKHIWDESGKTKLSLDMIEKAVVKRDDDTQEIYERYIKVWAISLINIIALFDPQIIIIGGKINAAHTMTLEKIKHYVRKGTLCEPTIEISQINEKAALVGGLHITKSYVFNNMLLNAAIN